MEYDLINSIWFAPAILILIFALYNSAEGITKVANKKLAIHHYKQACFMFFCAVLAIVIDQYLLIPIFAPRIDNLQVLNVLRFLLFPALVFLAAKIHGGKKDQKIELDSIRKRRHIK